MGFWVILFLTLAALSLGGIWYLVTRFHRFSPLQRLGKTHPKIAWLLSILPVLLLLSSALYNLFTMFVIVLHLVVFWLLWDFLTLIWSKVRHAQRNADLSGAGAILSTVILLGCGWYLAHHVVQTNYTLTTDKSLSTPVRIAMLADSHLSLTLDGTDFAAQLARIQAQHPDLLVICGDFVDDDSTRDDMEAACKAFGDFSAPYGVYYVQGNHDEGYGDTRDFSYEYLLETLRNSGVCTLADETKVLENGLAIVGRLDTHHDTRQPVASLLADCPEAAYRVVLDHQPNDYAAESSAGADLVLSGHTHGGHLFPAGFVGLLLKANDFLYGTTTRDQTSFIVTSGISGWAIPFKTGTHSEYVIIDVSPT